MKLLLLIIVSIFVLQSCSYKLIRVEVANEKKLWSRYYYNYEDRFDYNAKCIFKAYDADKKFEKYNSIILSDTIESLTYFQFDTIRIYLGNESEQFKMFFSSGLISPQTIYCELDSSCLPPVRDNSLLTLLKTGESTTHEYYGWKGPYFFLDCFTEVNNSKSSTSRRFSFKRINSSGFSVFFFEIKNEKGNPGTTLDEFIEGSELTFFKYGWSEI